MWGKLLAVLAIVAVVGTAGLVSYRTIIAYGDARYATGRADAQVAQIPAIRAADAEALRIALEGRDRVIAAQDANLSEVSRLGALALAAQERVTAYAQTAAGMAACLGPDRVRGIEADRVALFPAAPGDEADSSQARPLPADLLAGAPGRQPQ